MAYIVNRGFSAVFPVQFNLADGTTLELHLRSPQMKVLTRFKGVDLNSAEAIDALIGLAVDVLNTNAEGKIFGRKTVEALTFDQISGLLTAYMEWLSNTKKIKN